MRKQPIDDAIATYYDTLYTSEETDVRPADDPFMESLARGTAAEAFRLDERIGEKSERWRIERMPAVDRNILRLAVYEMTRVGTAPAIVIDEALELARQFSGEEAVGFVNGVLDAVRKDLP
jgi:N utilization substance protein B